MSFSVIGVLAGTSLSVIIDLDVDIAIVASAAVAVLYTLLGQMISVAYTDVIQLGFLSFGLVSEKNIIMIISTARLSGAASSKNEFPVYLHSGDQDEPSSPRHSLGM